MLLILVAFDLSALVRYITRFTEESFAALISLIFIVESIVKLFNIASDYPINLNPEVPLNYNCSCDLTNVTLSPNISVESIGKTNCTKFNGTLIGGGCDTPIYYADVFFFSVLLFLFTFSLAYFLKMSRNAPVFPTWVSLQSSLLSGLFFSAFVCPHKCGFALLSLRHNGPSEIVLSCYQGLYTCLSSFFLNCAFRLSDVNLLNRFDTEMLWQLLAQQLSPAVTHWVEIHVKVTQWLHSVFIA